MRSTCYIPVNTHSHTPTPSYTRQFNSHSSRQVWVSRFSLYSLFPYILFKPLHLHHVLLRQEMEEKGWQWRKTSGGKVHSMMHKHNCCRDFEAGCPSCHNHRLHMEKHKYMQQYQTVGTASRHWTTASTVVLYYRALCILTATLQ